MNGILQADLVGIVDALLLQGLHQLLLLKGKIIPVTVW